VPIRILVVDDHPLVCEGVRAVLSTAGDFEVVGTLGDARAAVRASIDRKADVVLMDVSMPGMNGIEATERLCSLSPAIRVVMLSMHDSPEHVYRALRAGASGYLLKESVGREVVDAVRAVHAGKRYLCRQIASSPMVKERLAANVERSPLESLSKREREILQLVVEGKSNADIATLLSLSPKTTETYKSRLMYKLGLGDVPSLVKFAIRHGVTSVD
jgi:DNA-binding NarL/FixJ family response regulator